MASNEPITNPIINTQKTGKTTEDITGGNCLLYTWKYTIKYITIIHSTHTKRVKNIVRVPPMLKNLWLFNVKIYDECLQLYI